MAAEWIQEVLSYPVGADLTAADSRKFVKFNASRQVVLCDSLTDRPIGVLRDTTTNVKAGDTVAVVVGGIALVRMTAAAATLNSLVSTTTAGKGAVVVAGTDTTRYIAAITHEVGGAADEFVGCLIVPAVAKAV